MKDIALLIPLFSCSLFLLCFPNPLVLRFLLALALLSANTVTFPAGTIFWLELNVVQTVNIWGAAVAGGKKRALKNEAKNG